MTASEIWKETPLAFADVIDQKDACDAGGLFQQLGYGRDPGFLAPEIIAADTAVDGGKGKDIGQKDQQIFAAGIPKKVYGCKVCIFLQKECNNTG